MSTYPPMYVQPVQRCKPSSCQGCQCLTHGTDFSAVEGLGSIGVLVVGEASGEQEAREGLPLRPFAPSGGIFQRTLARLGYSRDQFATTNVLRCFISPRTAVLTSNGYREIAKIQPGELVLTHMGRFRPVVQMLKFVGDKECVEVTYAKQSDFKRRTKHAVTVDHRFWMSDGSWKLAKDIAVGDKVKFLAEHCVVCESAFHRHFSRYQKGLPFCSTRCQNIHAARKGRDKISISMRQQYALGVRDASTIALAANDRAREMVAAGEWVKPRTAETIASQRLACALTRQRMGHDVGSANWIGFGEEAVAELLTSAGYEFVPQFAIDGYNYDFKIDDLILEVDGPGSRNVVRKVRDAEKERLAVEAGFRVVHIPHDRPESALDVMANDNHLYDFIDIEVESVLRRPCRNGVWSLQVEEDESFVAQGAVHHNCRPKENFLDGAPWEIPAIDHCRPNLVAAIRQHQPKVIVALGNIAFRTLTGISGSKRTVSHMRGYVFRALPEFCAAAGIRDLLVVPTYHPAFLRRGAIHLSGILARDIQRAVNIRAGKDRSFILDLPSFAADSQSAWGAEHPEDPFADQAAVRETQQRIAEESEAWLQRYNLRYLLNPTRAALDVFCRDVKARAEGFQALSPDERAASFLALSYDLETFESASLDEDESDGFSDTRIRLAQFTIEPGQGLALNWQNPEHRMASRFLLKQRLPKVGHNAWLFDNRVLRAVGRRDFGDGNYLLPTSDAPVHDTLAMFHYWQPDLPAHLQFAASFAGFPFPWKHLSGSALELYGIADTDAALRVYLVVRRTMIDRGIWFDVQPERQAAGYVAMVAELRPILEAMELRGFPVDDAKRLELDAKFEIAQREELAKLDQRFPDACRKMTPREAGKLKGYAGVPEAVKEILERIRPTELPVFTEEVTGQDAKGRDKVVVRDAAGAKVTKKFRDETLKTLMKNRWAGVTAEELAEIRAVRFTEKPDIDDLPDGVTPERIINEAGNSVWVIPGDDGGLEEITGATYWFDRRIVGQQRMDDGVYTPGELRWVRVYQFSPNAPKQIQAYMEFKRHKIPTKKTGEATTSKTEILRLATKHGDDFYTKVIEVRELGKARGTFINGFKPGPDGRAHTTFTFATATGQLSSRNPANFQNVPKHGTLAKEIRGIFVDANGKLIVEWDFKAYHVLTTGFAAKCADYMRMAKLDMHSFVAGHFNKDWDAFKIFSETDEELAERFAWFKRDDARKFIRDKKAKPSILGIGFGLGVIKLFDMNRESFASLGEAKLLQDVIRGLFPKVFRWQEEIRAKAHRDGFLKNDFGMIRWFYEVYAPDGHGGWKPGEQSEQAIAFLPASNAFGNIREAMKELDRRGIPEKWEQVNTIHDSLLFLVEPDGLEEHMADVYPVLHAPSKVLVDPQLAPGGLVVDAECSASGQTVKDKKTGELKQLDKSWANLTEVKIPEWILKRGQQLGLGQGVLA